MQRSGCGAGSVHWAEACVWMLWMPVLLLSSRTPLAGRPCGSCCRLSSHPQPCLTHPACSGRSGAPSTPKSARVLLPSPVKSHDVESGRAAAAANSSILDGTCQPGWKDSPASSEH